MEHTEHILTIFTFVIAIIGLATILFFIYMNLRLTKKNKALEKKVNELHNYRKQQVNKDSANEYKRLQDAVYEDKLYADQNLDRDAFAARMNISRHALNRVISGNTNGQSFPQWINNIRIERACEMLRNEPYKAVADIAKEVGLTQNNFHRLFRLRFNKTPNEYRQNG